MALHCHSGGQEGGSSGTIVVPSLNHVLAVLACPYADWIPIKLQLRAGEAEVTGPAACTAMVNVGGLCAAILVIIILNYVP